MAQAAVITLVPSPVLVTDNCCYGTATVVWNAPEASHIKILIDSPSNGNLFTDAGSSGQATTSAWIMNGTTFIW